MHLYRIETDYWNPFVAQICIRRPPRHTFNKDKTKLVLVITSMTIKVVCGRNGISIYSIGLQLYVYLFILQA